MTRCPTCDAPATYTAPAFGDPVYAFDERQAIDARLARMAGSQAIGSAPETSPDFFVREEAAPTREEVRKMHRCGRCNESFDCQHGPNCQAGAVVMPNIINPDGRSFREHCPLKPDWEWIRAYGDRMRAGGHIEHAKVTAKTVQELASQLTALQQENGRLLRELGTKGTAASSRTASTNREA